MEDIIFKNLIVMSRQLKLEFPEDIKSPTLVPFVDEVEEFNSFNEQTQQL